MLQFQNSHRENLDKKKATELCGIMLIVDIKKSADFWFAFMHVFLYYGSAGLTIFSLITDSGIQAAKNGSREQQTLYTF